MPPLGPRATGLLILGSVLSGACASGRGRTTVVDLAPARRALEAARQAGAPAEAPASFAAAQQQLKKAEALVAGRDAGPAREAAVAAEWMARLAAVEARCQATQTTLRTEIQTAAAGDAQRLQTRLRRSEDEQRRLEDRLTAQQRDLEVTEMELIRTKARLKGLETKAEASSAIAEARILLRRAESRGGALLALGQQSLTKAEQQLLEENFGAAVFFALKAQDLATRAQEAPGTPRTGGPIPLSVTVRAPRANIRKGPASSEVVVAVVPRGSKLAVKRAQGDWFEVSHGTMTGWVSRTVVD
jgi:hypothetical protein